MTLLTRNRLAALTAGSVGALYGALVLVAGLVPVVVFTVLAVLPWGRRPEGSVFAVPLGFVAGFGALWGAAFAGHPEYCCGAGRDLGWAIGFLAPLVAAWMVKGSRRAKSDAAVRPPG